MAFNGQLDTNPTKRFFVDMLTRDIDLDDAVLDLLDNCVDGALRVEGYQPDEERPYEGYEASLEFSKDMFRITDNCGGIPESLIESAFRLGRPFGAHVDANLPTVGMYGIGMKRAIFKIGRECVIETRTDKSGFRVTIPHDWFSKEGDWKVPVVRIPFEPKNIGTQITVRRLLAPVAHSFGSPTGFSEEFSPKVSQIYSVLMEKGFSVTVNKKKVAPTPITFKTADFEAISEEHGGIAPYLFEGKVSGVDVELACGFYTPYSEDADDEATAFKIDEAGWTVICNDRVVLHKDKSILTGWGDGTPNYHPQFRQIAGVVIFSSKDPTLLPLTTTKRGIEATSEVYLRVRQKMRDGLKKFTGFTNKLKALSLKARDELFEKTETVNLKELRVRKEKIPTTKWSKDQKVGGRFYDAPLPKFSDSDIRLIRFTRPTTEVKKVSKFLFDDSDRQPSEVGATCFDRALKDARKK
jgi:Histidine kinase-, DNA gyrase B-, and HSP90-like ATPase